MARRDHHRSVRAEPVLQQHEHGRRRRKPCEDDVPAAGIHCVRNERRDVARRKAGIMPDGNDGLCLSRPLRRPDVKSLRDKRDGFIRQRDGIVLDARDRGPAHVGPVLELKQLFSCHSPPSFARRFRNTRLIRSIIPCDGVFFKTFLQKSRAHSHNFSKYSCLLPRNMV